MDTPSYLIGIDLGTTNCTLTYTPFPSSSEKGLSPSLHSFPISQVMSAQTEGTSLSLPSFIYYPLQEELQAKVLPPPWEISRSFAVGTFARERGAEVPTRLIASAKSWLCHTGINRREKILPLEGEDGFRMSPLEACAEMLSHLREAWERAKPEAPFFDQRVLVTVPASFDPSAREFVQEAAKQAGYPEIILLEEPQAAFYAWLHAHAEEWRQQLKVGDSVLVIDIGGGTTDFSLIGVEEEGGNLHLKRQAVGSHLLLGGDNMDLALAHFVKQKLEHQGHAIDPWQFQSLIHPCRQAKEQLMGEDPPEKVEITLLGRGSRLIGRSLKTELLREETCRFILEGFAPLVGPEERSSVERRMGIQQIGLPYVQDPRISCQLAKFLSMTGESDQGKGQGQMKEFILPTAVLFNGGTLKSPLLRQQLMAVLNQWAKELKKPPIKELGGADYDYAVSRGAAYYGLARQGNAIRIRGGTSRSYFVGVEEAAPAVPGIAPPLRAICIVPFGMEEGEERRLEQQEFALVLGEPATFRFFSHSTPQLSSGIEPAVGMVLRNWKEELTELPPIETLLDKTEGDGKTVHVKLKSKVTELGVLELWCEAADGRRWKLEFNIRE